MYVDSMNDSVMLHFREACVEWCGFSWGEPGGRGSPGLRIRSPKGFRIVWIAELGRE